MGRAHRPAPGRACEHCVFEFSPLKSESLNAEVHARVRIAQKPNIRCEGEEVLASRLTPSAFRMVLADIPPDHTEFPL